MTNATVVGANSVRVQLVVSVETGRIMACDCGRFGIVFDYTISESGFPHTTAHVFFGRRYTGHFAEWLERRRRENAERSQPEWRFATEYIDPGMLLDLREAALMHANDSHNTAEIEEILIESFLPYYLRAED